MNTSTKETTNIAKQVQREYYRQWRARNKDKVKQYNKRYWEKKAAAMKEGTNNV